MKIKRKVWVGVGVLACVGAALWMRELASWRPVLLGTVPQTNGPQSLQLSPDERFLVAGFQSIFDLQTGRWAPSVPLNENFYAFASSQSYFCARYDPGQDQLYISHVWRRDLESGRALWKSLDLKPALNDAPLFVRLRPDINQTQILTQRRLKTLGPRGELVSSRPLRRFTEGFLTPRGALITLENFDHPGLLLSRDAATLRPLWKALRTGFDMGDITPDGQTLWFTRNGKSHFLDASTGKEKWNHPLMGDQNNSMPPSGFGFSGDSRIVAMMNWTGVEFYSVQTGRFLGSKRGPGALEFAAAVPSSDSKWLYMTDKQNQIWRLRLH